MAARAWFSYFMAPIAVLTSVALTIALLWLAGLFALVPALVFAAVLLVIGYLDRRRYFRSQPRLPSASARPAVLKHRLSKAPASAVA